MTVDHRPVFGADAEDGEVQLVDLLDRLLATGACIDGDLLLSVAGIDLIWVGLRSIIASVETARPRGRVALGESSSTPASRVSSSGPTASSDLEHVRGPSGAPPSPSGDGVPPVRAGGEGIAQPSRRLDLPEEHIERGLVQLVLTIVDLLRQLMERQAIARMEGGGLGESEVDRLGTAFARLAMRMDELKEMFGLTEEDLELRLGPIGSLA